MLACSSCPVRTNSVMALGLQIPHGKCFDACFNLLHKTRCSSSDSCTEFSPRSFVSISEWLLHLNETVNKENSKSLVWCLGQMLSAGKHSASFCPNDTLQFEHIHNLMNSPSCLSNFIGIVLQQGAKKNYLRWAVNVQCLLYKC